MCEVKSGDKKLQVNINFFC